VSDTAPEEGWDADGDGHGALAAGGDDCDDDDPSVSPSAQEACENLVDDDCDGTTDEGCALDSASPPDPGGFYWICGLAPGPPAGATGPALLAVLALALAARRRGLR
jgi:MYXO-CTERM domain-containing protein